MFITSLSEMERLVDSRSDLEWEGWDVVRYKKNADAQFEKNGVFRKNTWYNKTVYPITSDGWSIPERLVNAYV